MGILVCPGVVKCLFVAELLQTTLKPKEERDGPAGVIPTHVHRFAWVDVLGIVSAEFLSRAVTDADRRDLPLALLLFGQVFLQRKQLQPVCSLEAHHTDVPLKAEGKNITVRIMSGKGEAFWQISKSQGRFASKWICLPVSSVWVGLCVSRFWCLLTLHLGTHTATMQK